MTKTPDEWRDEIKLCSICHDTYIGWGNNAEPVNAGRCCDECNDFVVVPARIRMMYRKSTEPPPSPPTVIGLAAEKAKRIGKKKVKK